MNMILIFRGQHAPFVIIKHFTMKKKQARIRPYPHYKFPDEVIIKYGLLKESDCKWFNLPLGSYQMWCVNYGWFPTNSLMGVIKGKFEDTNKIGAKLSGNMGSMSIAVIDVNTAIAMLKKEGFNIEPA